MFENLGKKENFLFVLLQYKITLESFVFILDFFFLSFWIRSHLVHLPKVLENPYLSSVCNRYQM